LQNYSGRPDSDFFGGHSRAYDKKVHRSKKQVQSVSFELLASWDCGNGRMVRAANQKDGLIMAPVVIIVCLHYSIDQCAECVFALGSAIDHFHVEIAACKEITTLMIDLSCLFVLFIR
jgi:hypothetical protein